jgi:hypothetical protein
MNWPFLLMTKFLPLSLLWLTAFSLHAEPAETAQPSTPAETEKTIEALVADSQRHAVQRPSDPQSPLRLAEQYAAWIAGDATEYAQVMVGLVMEHIQQGQTVDATYLMDHHLPGSGRLQAHAKLARHHAEKGQLEEARQQQAEAEKWLHQANGEALQRVLLDLLFAAKITDNSALLERLKGQLTEVSQYELEILSIKQGLQPPAAEFSSVSERLKGIQAKGVEELKARYCLALAEVYFKTQQEEKALVAFDAAGAFACSNGLAHEYHVLLDLAQLAQNRQQPARAKKCLNLYLTAVDKFPAAAEWRTPYITEAVTLMNEWGQKEQAAAWLKTARENAAKVHYTEAAQAHLSTAQLVEKLEGPEAADAVALTALRTGLAHPHQRIKGRASVQTCLYYHRQQRAVPASILQALQKAADTPTETAPQPAKS